MEINFTVRICDFKNTITIHYAIKCKDFNSGFKKLHKKIKSKYSHPIVIIQQISF